MKQLIRPFLAGVICFAVLYGFLWILGFLIEGTFNFGGGEILGVNDSTTPNHQYVATTFTDIGGGAAGWCYRAVILRNNDERFDPKKNRVFNIQCGSEVGVSWKDDRDLLITFSKDPESLSLYQKSLSDDGAIRIAFAIDSKATAASR